MESDSAARKATPIFSGVLRYFPNALAAVARLSKAGNDKHNPGEPLHWSRSKSNDHGDCIVRHQLEFDAVDPETGEYHAVAVAWRALAQLELLEESKPVQVVRSMPIEPPVRQGYDPSKQFLDRYGAIKTLSGKTLGLALDVHSPSCSCDICKELT